jgi:hypothetical protein
MPAKPKTPKPQRRRVDKVVLDFKNKCKLVAMSRSGVTRDLHLGLVKLFMENDADGDGTLNRGELQTFINQKLKMGYTEYQCNTVFRYFDDDNGGAISATEIVHDLDRMDVRDVPESRGSVSTHRSSVASVASTVYGREWGQAKPVTPPSLRHHHKSKCIWDFQRNLMAEAHKKIAASPNMGLRSALTAVFQEIDADKSYTLSRWEMGDFIHINLHMAISEQQVGAAGAAGAAAGAAAAGGAAGAAAGGAAGGAGGGTTAAAHVFLLLIPVLLLILFFFFFSFTYRWTRL